MQSAGRNELLLLSGGIDSACIAYERRPKCALTVDYGQLVATSEMRAAATICRELGIEHHTLVVDLRAIGGGVMSGRAHEIASPTPEWWPFRNQLLITLGAAKAISLGIDSVIIGTVRSDSVHADGSAKFVETIQTLLQIQEGAVRLEAPALSLETDSLLRRCGAPHSFIGWTFSCHMANEPCGACRGCYKHLATIESVYGL